MMEVPFNLLFGVRRNSEMSLGPRFIGLRFGHLMLMQTWHTRCIQNKRNMYVYLSMLTYHSILEVRLKLNCGFAWGLHAFLSMKYI